MKNVVLKNSNKFAKIEKKLFTGKERNSRIKSDYNPLSKDYGIYERGGLYMKEKSFILKELKKNMNWKSKIFANIFSKTAITLYRKGMVDCFKYYNKDGTF